MRFDSFQDNEGRIQVTVENCSEERRVGFRLGLLTFLRALATKTSCARLWMFGVPIDIRDIRERLQSGGKRPKRLSRKTKV